MKTFLADRRGFVEWAVAIVLALAGFFLPAVQNNAADKMFNKTAAPIEQVGR
jgi:hypothetical protein